MTNKEKIMEKKVEFEVGKWYKNLSIHSKENTFGKFLNLRSNNKEFWMSEYIYNGKFHSTQGWLNYSSETVEIDIEEIQQFLPEGHPDKIKSTDSLKMILSIDDEELPMVSIIKTNSIKQLLKND